jgi:stage III sporulation protein AD
MELYKIIAVGLICSFVIVYLKSTDSNLAMPLTVCSGIILLSMTLGFVTDFLKVLKGLSSNSYVGGNVLKLAIKIMAISYLVEFSASTIEDFGIKSIADKVVFAGKIVILTISAPIIETLISTILSLL